MSMVEIGIPCVACIRRRPPMAPQIKRGRHMGNRRFSLPAFVLALLVTGLYAGGADPFLADDSDWNGTWKLVVLAFGEDEFATVKLNREGGKSIASVADAQPFLGRPRVKHTEQQGDKLTINLHAG